MNLAFVKIFFKLQGFLLLCINLKSRIPGTSLSHNDWKVVLTVEKSEETARTVERSYVDKISVFLNVSTSCFSFIFVHTLGLFSVFFIYI